MASPLAYWEWAEYSCTFIVLVGAVGEFAADFTRLRQKRRLKERVGKLSTLLLLAGLAGELVTLVTVSKLADKVIEDTQLSAERARVEAAEANLRASNARLQAEQLKALVSWREVTPTAHDRFRALTVTAPKGPVLVQSVAGNSEAVNYAHQLARMLGDAGYSVSENVGSTMSFGTPPTGVQLHADGQNVPSEAEALANALVQTGIDIKCIGDSKVITIFVGNKS